MKGFQLRFEPEAVGVESSRSEEMRRIFNEQRKMIGKSNWSSKLGKIRRE